MSAGAAGRGPTVGCPGACCYPSRASPSCATVDRYASLECGDYGGGHGHPDRLHLTLHAGGVHWLADPGTGSYVSPDLFWYRSTLAHNAPARRRAVAADGAMPAPRCSTSAAGGAGSAAASRGSPALWWRARRIWWTCVEFADDQEHLVELPWHPDGELEIAHAGPLGSRRAGRLIRHRRRALRARRGRGRSRWRAQPKGDRRWRGSSMPRESCSAPAGQPGPAGRRPSLSAAPSAVGATSASRRCSPSTRRR